MSKLVLEISMSLDGYVAGPNATLDDPLGKGGERLHDWIVGLDAWREAHGLEGGERTRGQRGGRGVDGPHGRGDHGPQDVQRRRRALGGRPERRRLVGRRPAVPRSGLRADAPRPRAGDEGRHDDHVRHRRDRVALAQARESAGEKDVHIAGGANVAQQYLAAGLVDEIDLHIVPVLLGDGVRLFDGLGANPPKLELVRTIESPAVTHLRYRVVR